MDHVRRCLPPILGRADLIRAGLDLEGAERQRATWYGFDFRLEEAVRTSDLSGHPERGGSGAVRTTVSPIGGFGETGTPILCKRCTTLRELTEPSMPPPTTPRAVAWGSRPKKAPQYYTLTDRKRITALIERIVNVTHTRGSPDIPRVVAALADARPLLEIPRRIGRSKAAVLQIVVDRSTRLTPLWFDQTLVVQQIREEFPGTAHRIWVFEEAAGDLRPLTPDLPSRPDPTQGPLLVLGDLGLFAGLSVLAWWRMLAREFVFSGGTAHVLLPESPESVPTALVGPWVLHSWEKCAELMPSRPDMADKLLTLASPAIRLEPGLLRAIRIRVAQEACVRDEIAVWADRALSSRSVEAATFEPEAREYYLRRFEGLAIEDPTLVKASLAELRAWRQLGADEIWFEEVLGLPAAVRNDPDLVPPEDLAAADAFFANLHSTAHNGRLLSGQEAWLSRVGRRQKARDGLWQNSNAAAAIMAVLRDDPSFVPPIIVDTAHHSREWHANVALDSSGDLWISSGQLVGQSLGTLPMLGSEVELVTPDDKTRLAHATVEQTGRQVRLGPLEAPALLKSSTGRLEISQAERRDVLWADRLGSDTFGPFAELRLNTSSLRFRWIPPGRTIIGHSLEESGERAEARRDEIVFATGFWLMERPLTVADIHEITLPPYGSSISDLGEDRDLPAVNLTISRASELFRVIRAQSPYALLRLPTPAEWEYACRARIVDAPFYPPASSVPSDWPDGLVPIAWFAPPENMAHAQGLRHLHGPQPVMQKLPNPWGLYDMLGNVAEWCQPETDSPDTAQVKGGSFRHGPEDIRFAYTERISSHEPHNWVGVRPAIGKGEIELLRMLERATPTREFIARNRPPRVMIEYSFELYGAEKQVELPFVLGVMSDLAGQPDIEKPDVADRRFLEIDISNFDARMKAVRPRLTFRIPSSGIMGEFKVDLTFESIADFSPGAVAHRIPNLRERLDARRNLVNLITYMDGNLQARDPLADIMEEPNLLARLASPEPYDTSFNLRERLLKALGSSSPALDGLEDAVRSLAGEARRHPDLISSDTFRTMNAFIYQIDLELTDAVNSITHHPDFQSLESAWRGLYFLVTHTETDQLLKIRFMPLSKAELHDALIGPEFESLEQSPVFKKIYSEEFEQLGGEPYGCLIGDYAFSHHPKDVELLSAMAGIAAAAHAPFLAGTDSALFQMESWQDLENPRDLTKITLAPEYAAWRSLRESDDSKYIALAMPRILGRQPYGVTSNPVEEFAFEEDIAGAESSKFIWVNAAYGMATNIARSFKEYGWFSQIRGFQSGGAIADMPTAAFPTDDGSVTRKGPTEIGISDRREAELARAGLMPLLHLRNTDRAAFIGAHSLHEPPEYTDPDATANAHLLAHLPYLLAACRFAHYLKCIARDKVGSFKSRDDMRNWLQNWIDSYVVVDPHMSSEAMRARRPLAAADVLIKDVEGDPGYYNLELYLRPHYQMEALTAQLRLVSRLRSEFWVQ